MKLLHYAAFMMTSTPKYEKKEIKPFKKYKIIYSKFFIIVVFLMFVLFLNDF